MRRTSLTIAACLTVLAAGTTALGQVQIQMPAPPRPAYSPPRPPAVPSTLAPTPAPREVTVGDVAFYRYAQVRNVPRQTYGPRYVDVYSHHWGRWWGWPSWRFIGPPIICPSHKFGGFSTISIFGVN